MSAQELKEKIVDIIKNNTREPLFINGKRVSCYDVFAIQEEKINTITDALIAAGLTFDKTAERAFKLYLKDNLECERCVDRMNGVCNASAEEKADCANRTLSLYKEYAEKELEGKDE